MTIENINDYKVPILSGINDVPSSSGDLNHPNDSLFNAKYNSFLDVVNAELNNLGIGIAAVSSEVIDNNTVVSLYSDVNETILLGTINIPNGIDGVDGISIAAVSSEVIGNNTVVSLYSDVNETILLGAFNVPNGINGVDGISIAAVSSEVIGNNTVVSLYSDVNETILLGTINIPNGIDGVDGVVDNAGSIGLLYQSSSPVSEVGKFKLFALDTLDIRGIFDDDTTFEFVSANKNNSFTKAQSITPINVTYNPNITLNFSDSNNFRIVGITGDLILNNPLSVVDGQDCNILLISDNVGNHTVSFGSNFGFIQSITLEANVHCIVSCHCQNNVIYAVSVKGLI